jgi:hypothetical protein
MIRDLVKKLHVFGSRKAKMTQKKEKSAEMFKSAGRVLEGCWKLLL